MPDIIPEPFANSSMVYTRNGSCNRCGECCVGCPHYGRLKGSNACLIYTTRANECESCKIILGKVGMSYTHAVCENFPDHPYLNCLKDGQCGYVFMAAPVEVEP